MAPDQFELVKAIVVKESDAPRDRDIYFRCENCGDIIPSQPDDNLGCKCGNIFIDVDYVRLAVKDFGKFTVVRKVSRRK